MIRFSGIWKYRLHHHSIRWTLVVLYAVACCLGGSHTSTAQQNGYDCLHLLASTPGSDWAYNLNLNVVLPQQRLPGPTHQYLKSADGKWYAFESAIRNSPQNSNIDRSPLLSPNVPLLYAGATFKGNVRFSADNPLGFVQTHLVPLSIRWSPQQSQLAYLYVKGTNEDVPQVSLAVLDATTQRKWETAISYPLSESPLFANVLGMSGVIATPLLEWSPDGKYLAVMSLNASDETGHVSISVSIYDSATLGLVSTIVAPSPTAIPIALNWLAHDNWLAIYWTDVEGKPNQISVVQPGTKPRTLAYGEQRVVQASQLLWSPDGAYLAIQQDYKVTILDIDTFIGTTHNLNTYDLGDLITGLHWTPDSRSLVLIKSTGPSAYLSPRDLLAYHIEARSFSPILKDISNVSNDTGNFFPDSYRQQSETDRPLRPIIIANGVQPDGQPGLYVVNLDTLQQHRLLPEAEMPLIEWSADQSSFVIFYLENVDNKNVEHLYWVSADGNRLASINLGGNMLERSQSEEAVTLLWLDKTPYIAYIAMQPPQKDDTGSQAAMLVNLKTGTLTTLASGLDGALLNRNNRSRVELAWVEHNARNLAYVGAYALTGNRMFRYAFPLANVGGYAFPVQTIASPNGLRVAFLGGYSLDGLGTKPLYLLHNQELMQLIPPAMGSISDTTSEYGGYTGAIWSPDGSRLVAYQALTFPLDDGYGRSDTPIFTRIDIYSATGDYVATVPTRGLPFDENARVYGVLWKHCDKPFPDPYTPADLKYGFWLVPPG